MTKENDIAKRLEQALREVALIQAGKLPKRSAWDMMNDLKEEIAKEQMDELYKRYEDGNKEGE